MTPEIAIITALPREFTAVQRVMHPLPLDPIPGDITLYAGGMIPGSNSSHYVVAACQPKYANNPAAATVTNIVRSFPTVQDIIFVGIAGGIPSPKHPERHVRLGDVVVSSGHGIIQFDIGVHTDTEFIVKDTSPPPSARLLQAVHYLESKMSLGRFDWQAHVSTLLSKANLKRPKEPSRKSFVHPRDPTRKANVPAILRGKIGASNAVVKNEVLRDNLAKTLGIIAIEMEGSGIADASWQAGKGYIIIRGICDYADHNKNDSWQDYAANTASAYLSALLQQLPGSRPKETPAVGAVLGDSTSPQNAETEFLEDCGKITSAPHLFGSWHLIRQATAAGRHQPILFTTFFSDAHDPKPLRVLLTPSPLYPTEPPLVTAVAESTPERPAWLVRHFDRVANEKRWKELTLARGNRLVHLIDDLTRIQSPEATFANDAKPLVAGNNLQSWRLSFAGSRPSLTKEFSEKGSNYTISAEPGKLYPRTPPTLTVSNPACKTFQTLAESNNLSKLRMAWISLLPTPGYLSEFLNASLKEFVVS